jgi:hypothetical protein
MEKSSHTKQELLNLLLTKKLNVSHTQLCNAFRFIEAGRKTVERNQVIKGELC